MWLAPITLRGFGVTLEPLSPAHAPALSRVMDPHVFRYFPGAPPHAGEQAMRAYVEAALADAGRVAFAVLTSEGVVGSTSYLDVRPAHKGVEIGATFYAPSVRGTFVNPACKLLLLRHAFEERGAHRVQLKCDARNERSVAAIRKLGATHEGVLRQHMVMPDGFVRDTVMFSVVRAEWASVREGLLERLRSLHAPELGEAGGACC